MTKREIQSQNMLLKIELDKAIKQGQDLTNQVELLSFAVALSDIEVPLAKAAAYAIRDGVHTEAEAAEIVDLIATRLIGHITLVRGAFEAQQKTAKLAEAPSGIILLN